MAYNVIYHGKFEDEVYRIPDQTVDLVVTSPPYAQQRADSYGGIDEKDYPAWTVNWMSEVKRILKPNGSVVINIRPHIEDGQLSDYMLHTRLAVRSAGWLECDEWIWYKPDAPPLGNNVHPRRAWESLHWFSLSKHPYCDATAIGARSFRLGISSKKGVGTYIGTGLKPNKKGIARSTNVIFARVGENDRSEGNTHSAQYPITLVQQIIQMLCPENGLVVDPFIGSGTTAVAALIHDRQYIGFEKEAEHVAIANRRIENCINCSLNDPGPDDFIIEETE